MSELSEDFTQKVKSLRAQATSGQNEHY